MNSRRQASLFSKPRPLKNPHLELNALWIIFQNKPRVLHEGGEGNPTSDWRFVAGIIHKIDCSWLGHEVNSSSKDDKERRAKNLNKIKMK